jgi:hypothetical protein
MPKVTEFPKSNVEKWIESEKKKNSVVLNNVKPSPKPFSISPNPYRIESVLERAKLEDVDTS